MSLFSSLNTASGALKAFSDVLSVTSNNVANSSTSGYAKLTQNLESMSFDPTSGTTGGVKSGEVTSSRSQYAEQAVWRQTTLEGEAKQSVSSLTTIESVLSVSDSSGLSTALNTLYSAFSSWGESASSTTARQTVIDDASDVATYFNDAANQLAQATTDTETQLKNTVDTVNSLVAQLKQYNEDILQTSASDAGVDTQMYAALETLSQYVDFSATTQADGTISVMMNGQTPLLSGTTQYKISYELQMPDSATNANGMPDAVILAADGSDITSETTSGQLGALLNVRNTVLPSYIGDANQTGSLNILAQTFADRVNTILTSGTTDSGDTGSALFTYDTTSVTKIAATLAVDSSVTTDDLAATDASSVSNGIPLALAKLSNPTDAADEIDGYSYTEYYAEMASQIGTDVSDASDQLTIQESAVSQAQSLRDDISGVSLDEEAMMMIEFQRAYEANSRMITILNQLTEDTINMLS